MASNDANFWKVPSIREDDYWRSYEATRPNYAEDGFMDLIYSYHLSKRPSSSFNTAHDVGCGSGSAAGEFASRFNHVIASDINSTSLKSARRFLTATSIAQAKFSFLQCTGDALAEHYPPQSADLIGVAESITLMDEMLALEAFATVLKPGGTLAIWFYGRPVFVDSDTCQSLFDQIMDRTFHKVINIGGPERIASWKKAGSGNRSWLDYLDFSTGPWERVQRLKWNSKTADLGWFTQRACEFPLDTLKSNVTDAEELIEKEDSQMWGRSWNIEGVKEFVNFCFPNIQEQVEIDDEISKLFEKLAIAMGGAGVLRPYTWPLVLILATKS